MAFTFALTTPAFAQEGADDPKAVEGTEDDQGGEGDEDAALAAARRRYGPNKSTATVGEKEIFLIGGKLPIEEDPDYPNVASLKDDQILVATLGQATKLSTQFDLKFGDTIIKNANFSPNYPGVYSVWLKKKGSGWLMVFNEKPDVWGTMHKDEFDVGQANATYTKLEEPKEGLKFDVKAEDGSGSLTIAWGEHQWSSAFTF